MTDTPPPLSYAAPPLTPAVPVDAAAAAPVSAADVPRLLAAARVAWRPIGRAVRYATFDAWSLAVFAAASLACTGGGVVGVLLGLALGAAAAAEFVGVRRLRRLDPAAPRLLAVNQLCLGGVLVLYAVWMLYLTSVGRGMVAELRSSLREAGLDGGDLPRTILNALYGIVALLGVILPGATAWFYASRTRLLRDFLDQTPDWLIAMQRDGSLV